MRDYEALTTDCTDCTDGIGMQLLIRVIRAIRGHAESDPVKPNQAYRAAKTADGKGQEIEANPTGSNQIQPKPGQSRSIKLDQG